MACRALAVQVEPSMRRSVLVDVLTVHGAAGKSIVFTQRRVDADEVAAGIGQVLPCEVIHQILAPPCTFAYRLMVHVSLWHLSAGSLIVLGSFATSDSP